MENFQICWWKNYIYTHKTSVEASSSEGVHCAMSSETPAAKYLPGKAPLDPKHDIIKFSNVALKSSLKGQKSFDIVHVEASKHAKTAQMYQASS